MRTISWSKELAVLFAFLIKHMYVYVFREVAHKYKCWAVGKGPCKVALHSPNKLCS